MVDFRNTKLPLKIAVLDRTGFNRTTHNPEVAEVKFSAENLTRPLVAMKRTEGC